MKDETPITRIHPLNDYIAVVPIEAKTETAGGIVLPDMTAENERPEEGTVIAVGPGRLVRQDGQPRRIPMQIRVGMQVLFARYSTESELDGQKFRMLKEEDLFGVIAPKETTDK